MTPSGNKAMTIAQITIFNLKNKRYAFNQIK